MGWYGIAWITWSYQQSQTLSCWPGQTRIPTFCWWLTLRWCLHDICTVMASSGLSEHLNSIVAQSQGMPPSGLLFSRVAGLIKMAVTVSTAYVTEIRLGVLVVLRDVILVRTLLWYLLWSSSLTHPYTFATSPDLAYDAVLLLEKHQAPTGIAAFSSDSIRETLASAVYASAVFVWCGVVKDVGRMGRILKLLLPLWSSRKVQLFHLVFKRISHYVPN